MRKRSKAHMLGEQMVVIGAGQNSDSLPWQAESFRLTAFLSPSAQVSEQDWWQAVTGEPPDRATSQPRIGLEQKEGTFKDEKAEGNLVLTTQPTRIDWQLVSIPDAKDPGFPTIGSFVDSLDSFLGLMVRWLEATPPVQRLAFGSTLNKSVNTSREGYRWISSYLPFDLDEDSSDFLYQINRPRQAASVGIDDRLLINRLSKWSVVLLSGFSFDPRNPEQYISMLPHFSARLELDINTAADFSGELTPNASQIFQELVELAKEIAVKGDIK